MTEQSCTTPCPRWNRVIKNLRDERSTLYAELAKYLELALPKVKPSCLVCGRDDYDEPAIKHLVIGSVVVCPRCKDAASREGGSSNG